MTIGKIIWLRTFLLNKLQDLVLLLEDL